VSHQGAACDATNVHFGLAISRTELLLYCSCNVYHTAVIKCFGLLFYVCDNMTLLILDCRN